MADLNSLFQYSPEVAAYFTGQNQANTFEQGKLNNQTLAQALAIAAAKEQRDADLYPVTKQGKVLENSKAQAELPGIVADARKKGTEAEKAAGTLQSDVDAGNTTNRMRIYQALSQHLGTLSTEIDNNPGVSPHVTLAQTLNNLDIPERAKQGLLQKYAGVPASQLSARLKADGSSILKETPAYVQAMDVEDKQGKNRMEVEKQRGANALAVAKVQAEARKKAVQSAAQLWEGTVQKAVAKGARAGYAAMNAAAAFFTQNDEPELAGKYTAMAEEIRPQAEAETANLTPVPGKVDITGATGGAVPTAPNRSITPPSRVPPQPTPPAAADVAAAAQKAWGSYEPGKYEYRFGPNGQLQRRAK